MLNGCIKFPVVNQTIKSRQICHATRWWNNEPNKVGLFVSLDFFFLQVWQNITQPVTLLTNGIAEFVDLHMKLTQVIEVTRSPEFPTRKNPTNGWKIKAQKFKQR